MSRGEFLLLTGATGFVGHHVLAALLRAGRRCAVLVADEDSGGRKVDALLEAIGVDAPVLRRDGRLVDLVGRLPGLPSSLGRDLSIDAVVHAAASTRFGIDSTGDPLRTNVDGTEALLEWSASRGIDRFDHVSTAFVGDARLAVVDEAPVADDGEHRNDYERSKAAAERLVRTWWADGGRTGTIIRPSIVVGAFGSGRATRFAGPYLAARAASAIAASLASDARRTVPLRMPGDPSARLDIVPVDWVGAMCAAIALAPAARSFVHLVHPAPPTYDDWQRAIERTWGLAGGRFVPLADFERIEPNGIEGAFLRSTSPILGYLLSPPRFGRSNCIAIERSTGLRCPRWTEASLDRLLAFARRTGFGTRSRGTVSAGLAVARYFESWLGGALERSSAVRRTRFTGAVRFAIDGVSLGPWTCRFENGLLAEVRRGDESLRTSCAFRMDESTFWSVVGGVLDAETGFLEGRVEVHGDVERAMALGTALREFNRECRVDRASLEESAA